MVSEWFPGDSRRTMLCDICEALHVADVNTARLSTETLKGHVRLAFLEGRLIARAEPREIVGGGRPAPPAAPPPPPAAPPPVSAEIVEQQVCLYAQRDGQPLNSTTLHANLEPPGGSATWTASNPDSV